MWHIAKTQNALKWKRKSSKWRLLCFKTVDETPYWPFVLLDADQLVHCEFDV